MRTLFCIVLLHAAFTVFAQPFRYHQGNDHGKDSIKLFHIAGYREYIANYPDSTQKILVRIVRYDTLGNLTYDCRIKPKSDTMNIWVYTYDSASRITSRKSYFPDSLNPIQEEKYEYDQQGNTTRYQATYFNNRFPAQTTITEQAYDTLNRCVMRKIYSKEGEVSFHKTYSYLPDQVGLVLEKSYDRKGKLISENYVSDPYLMKYPDEKPYGLPMEEDEALKALRLETKKVDALTGSYSVENGYDIRYFSRYNILLFWYQKNYLYHWFEYTYFNV